MEESNFDYCEHCGTPFEEGCDCREGIEEFYNAFYA